MKSLEFQVDMQQQSTISNRGRVLQQNVIKFEN